MTEQSMLSGMATLSQGSPLIQIWSLLVQNNQGGDGRNAKRKALVKW